MKHAISSGRRSEGKLWVTGILTDSSTAGGGGNTTSGTSSKGGAPEFFHGTTRMHSTDSRLHRSANSGAELHAPQEVRPIGHPAPRSCRGNDACATGRPLQTPGMLQELVCQTISRNWCGHVHLAGNLVAMSATHSTNQVSTRF